MDQLILQTRGSVGCVRHITGSSEHILMNSMAANYRAAQPRVNCALRSSYFKLLLGVLKGLNSLKSFHAPAETSTVSSLCDGKKSLFLTVAFRTSFCGLYLGNMRCALRLHKLVHNVHFLVICKGLHMNEISSRLSETRV